MSDYLLKRRAISQGLAKPDPTRQEQRKIEEEKEYKKLRHAFLKTHPFCQANLRDCGKVATEVHHSKGRGEYMLDVSTYKALCNNCHSYLETHVNEARKLGFTASRLIIHDKVEESKITIHEKIK